MEEEDFSDLPDWGIELLAAWTDMTALALPELRRLEARVPGLAIRSAWGVPFQMEGTLHGLHLYFKYKLGHASLSVGGDYAFSPLYQAGVPFTVADDFHVQGVELEAAFELLLPQLRRSPRLWEFQDAGGGMSHGAWGMTPDEAWRKIHSYDEDLADYISREQWEIIRTMRQPVWPTVTIDDRVWPDPEPEFRILPD